MIYFSYKDVKHSEIEHKPILAFLILGVILTLRPSNLITILPICLFWFVWSSICWKLNIFGGADVKILTILPLFSLPFMVNLIAGQFIFIMTLGIVGLMYALFAKVIQKNKEIPFVPIITLTYIINYIFWII